MRVVVVIAWLFVGLAVVIFHHGPGQPLIKRDQVQSVVNLARQEADRQNWVQAVERYDQALEMISPDLVQPQRQIRLEKYQAQMLASQLPEARQGLEALLKEMVQDTASEPQLVARVRSALASSQYYMTWLMRLEGLPKSQWGPEIEAARQNYRLNGELAELQGDRTLLARSRDDLESAIRLARMDLSQLQALPLPSQ